MKQLNPFMSVEVSNVLVSWCKVFKGFVNYQILIIIIITNQLYHFKWN